MVESSGKRESEVKGRKERSGWASATWEHGGMRVSWHRPSHWLLGFEGVGRRRRGHKFGSRSSGWRKSYGTQTSHQSQVSLMWRSMNAQGSANNIDSPRITPIP